MKQKRIFYTEAAYLVGIVVLAIGVALMERANCGMSMVVAPAYLLHLKLSPLFPAFSFGMAEYCLQAVLLVVLAAVTRRPRRSYLLSFGTAVFYGLVLDVVIRGVALLPFDGTAARGVYFLLGMGCSSVGVSLFFHTYITPEAYELFVKEIAARYHTDIHKTKTVYDCVSCAVSIALSFAFFGFGHFEGVKWGTVLCALLNGTVIGLCSRVLERVFELRDAFRWRRFFEG